ncbi:MAG TPA: fructosamine kinase family protein [Polyangiaceae bacterium LLY-WYZ-14_1]|nr:fructosamine kinase family protein [Polyangiaceae bacterium LLY-WYZ-14_1]
MKLRQMRDGAGLEAAVAQATGQQLDGRRALRAVAGGDINQAFVGALTDGTRVFVKTRAEAPAGMYRAEAAGLRWLAEPGAIRTPAVIGVHDPPDGGEPADRGEEGAPLPRCLVLEHVDVDPAAGGNDTAETLGRGLAAIHRAGAPAFGHPEDSFIGPFPQDNRPEATWARFYGERRLLPMARRAVDAGHGPESLLAAVEALVPRLPSLISPDEPPARLHGDLWGGNWMRGPGGEPVLIDPAVYGGHREMDLAMMQLFGGFPARVFDAYAEAQPLAPGATDRLALCQLYPLLVHAALFGGGYAASAERIARRYA